MKHGSAQLAMCLAIFSMLLLVGGCGGSGKATKVNGSAAGAAATPESAGSGRPPAAGRLIASADVICRRFNEQLAKAAISGSSDIAREAPRNAATELRAVDALSKLTPPASLASDWAQMIAYRRTLAQELGTLVRDVKAGDTAGMRALGASKKRVRQKLTQLAAHDGFKDCASVGPVNTVSLLPGLHPAAPAHSGG
jgi:hypothetical protein